MTEENTTPIAPTTPAVEEEADLKERIDGFNKELSPLLAKYELGLAAVPKIMQNGAVVADPVIVSMRGKSDKLKQQTQEKVTNPDA